MKNYLIAAVLIASATPAFAAHPNNGAPAPIAVGGDELDNVVANLPNKLDRLARMSQGPKQDANLVYIVAEVFDAVIPFTIDAETKYVTQFNENVIAFQKLYKAMPTGSSSDTPAFKANRDEIERSLAKLQTIDTAAESLTETIVNLKNVLSTNQDAIIARNSGTPIDEAARVAFGATEPVTAHLSKFLAFEHECLSGLAKTKAVVFQYGPNAEANATLKNALVACRQGRPAADVSVLDRLRPELANVKSSLRANYSILN